MKLRGERECVDCGTRWSYYETGSVTCPSCGSIESRATEDDPAEHTAGGAPLDLSAVRERVDANPVREVAAAAAETCREYVREHGFLVGGDVGPLTDTYLAARELERVAGEVERAFSLDDDEEWYFLSLLRGADAGERPDADAVPESFQAARGLAYAAGVSEFRRALVTGLDGRPDAAAGAALETLREHVRRVEALDGDVDPAEVERLVAAVRDVASYLADGDEDALAAARDRLDRLG